MFGYVAVSRGSLSAEDFRIFSAYYCGLCKAIGQECSQISRLALSYDITFLALVLSSVCFEDAEVAEGRCVVHPLKKRPKVKNDEAVNYAAGVGELLMYLKLKDDKDDDGSLKARLGMLALNGGKNKALSKYSETYDFISERLYELSELEKQKCAEIDKIADRFAKILGFIFTPDFIADADTRRILSWFGYNLGRWLYIIDAYDDMEKDHKSGAYNPFLVNRRGNAEEIKNEIRERVDFTLTLTLENMASALELLKLHRNRGLIENIVYQGLKGRQMSVLEQQNCATKEQKSVLGEE